MKTKFRHPALVNSSFTAFFISFTFIWAYVYSGYFPKTLKWQAFFLCVIFSLMIYVFKFLLNQFYDGVTILRLILLYFGLSAFMTFLSAVKSPIAEGQIPVIQILFFGPYIYSSAYPSLIVASVFPFYGAVTFVSSLLTSFGCEYVYSKLSSRLPLAIIKKLHKVDASIDKTSMDKSDWLFLEDERKGIAAVVILLFGYTTMYVGLLIF